MAHWLVSWKDTWHIHLGDKPAIQPAIDHSYPNDVDVVMLPGQLWNPGISKILGESLATPLEFWERDDPDEFGTNKWDLSRCSLGFVVLEHS